MDHELLDQKGDYFLERDDTYSSLKHEFSRIFHENNLHSLANASDFGFLELGKLATHGYSADYDDNQRGLGDIENICGRPYQKEEVSPYMGMGMPNSYSPMRFLQPNMASNIGYGANFQNLGNFVQDSSYYQPMQQYKYPDYGLDYGAQQNQMFSQNVYDMYNPTDMIDTHPNNPLSMMWSNEANRSLKTTETPQDFQQNAQNVMNRKFSAEAAQKRQSPAKPTSMKVEQDFEKVSNKTLGLQMEKVNNKASEPTQTATVGPRRTTRPTKPLYSASALKEEEDDSGSDDDKDEAFGDSKNRSSRGLRVLSLKVRDIVTKKKKTSYKEVAEALLQDLNQKMKGKSQTEIAKEEQNVKRRVYDALNVLIAAKILKKEGKLVCCDNSGGDPGYDKKKNKTDKASLIEQINEIKKRKKEKLEVLQQLVFKNLALKNLVRKNQQKEAELLGGKPYAKGNSQNVSATRIDLTQQQNLSLDQKTQDVVHFPFIVVMSSCPENSMNLNMDASQKQFSIEAKKEFNIYGDIDVLLKMKLHHVPKQVFDKETPKELQKYVSQSFIDQLK